MKRSILVAMISAVLLAALLTISSPLAATSDSPDADRYTGAVSALVMLVLHGSDTLFGDLIEADGELTTDVRDSAISVFSVYEWVLVTLESIEAPEGYASVHEQIVDATSLVASQASECRELAQKKSAGITDCFDLILESVDRYKSAREDLLEITHTRALAQKNECCVVR